MNEIIFSDEVLPIITQTAAWASVCVMVLLWMFSRHFRFVKEEEKQQAIYMEDVNRRVSDMVWEDFKKQMQPIGRYELRGVELQ